MAHEQTHESAKQCSYVRVVSTPNSACVNSNRHVSEIALLEVTHSYERTRSNQSGSHIALIVLCKPLVKQASWYTCELTWFLHKTETFYTKQCISPYSEVSQGGSNQSINAFICDANFFTYTHIHLYGWGKNKP